MNGLMNTLLYVTVIVLLGHFAFVQEEVTDDATSEDLRLNLYQEIIDILDESVDLLTSEPEKSEESLILAQETFERLSQGGFGSSAVTSGVIATFENALTAVTNRSEADLAIQTTVIKGGLQRLLYEVAADEASEGNLGLAKNYFSEVVQSMGGEEEDVNKIKESQDPLLIQIVLDDVAAKGMQANLQDATSALESEDITEAYQSIAQAYSNYVPVQDSPRISEATPTAFLGAINALVNEDPEAASTLQTLNDNVDNFAKAAESDLEQALTSSTTPESATSEELVPEEEIPEESTEEPVAEASPALSEEESVTPLPAATLEEPATALPLTPEVVEESSSPSPPIVVSPPVTSAPVPAAQGTVAPQTLIVPVAEPLSSDAESPSGGETQPASLAGSKVSEEELNLLYANAAQATVAIETGEQDQAREFIGSFEENYKSFFEPSVSSEDPKFAEMTNKLITGLKSAPALRLQDSVVLMGHVDAIRSLLEDKKISSTHGAIVTTSIFWAGILRLIVMIAVAVLAFIPLYLLNLAFGGGNRNWQWVGFALFLLLLPVIYEGLSFAGTLIADLTGIEAFGILSNFSFFQNVIAQLVWVVITVMAIIFSSIGLYGICVQFGLIGQGKEINTSVFDKESSVTVSDLGDDTIVDWDEEF